MVDDHAHTALERARKAAPDATSAALAEATQALRGELHRRVNDAQAWVCAAEAPTSENDR